ncbi:MAG TPA: Asp-tRNA(Asn)/Glu-tRNA(Gln) amidotransferase subunit GatC [Polyangiaceae bacterium]|nr:Asp-tRNA(Asn)/Glu-tRNA(Gln) amidotransferase subunit GatC [Polyangiaceae bacterium]
MSAAIDEAEVRRIAELCHLELNDDEVTRMTHELGAILGYVRQLQGVNTEGVAPTAHVLVDATTARPDVPRPSLDREAFLSAAPKANEDGFVVPAFVDEG